MTDVSALEVSRGESEECPRELHKRVAALSETSNGLSGPEASRQQAPSTKMAGPAHSPLAPQAKTSPCAHGHMRPQPTRERAATANKDGGRVIPRMHKRGKQDIETREVRSGAGVRSGKHVVCPRSKGGKQ